MSDEQPEAAAATVAIATPERTANFFEAYANNVQFELGPLDVVISFGRTRRDQPILQHSAITLAWPEAKVVAHLLKVNLALYEAIHGAIKIPDGLLPEPPREADQSNPLGKAIYEAVSKVHDEFMTSLK